MKTTMHRSEVSHSKILLWATLALRMSGDVVMCVGNLNHEDNRVSIDGI